MRQIEYSQNSTSIQSLIFSIENGKIIENNKYQKHFIWKNILKEELILTIFENMPIGSIVIWDNGLTKELIDGIQRVSIIKAFIYDELILSLSSSQKILNMFKDNLESHKNISPKSNILLNKMNQHQKIKLKFSILPQFLQKKFETHVISTTEIKYASIFQIKQYMTKIQHQEQIKASKEISSIPASDFINNIKEINLKKMAKNLNFSSSESDLIKLIINFHGIYEKKLALNISENELINYLKNNNEISKIFLRRLRLLSDELENNNYINKTLNKMSLKLLFIMRLLSNKFEIYDLKKLVHFIYEFIENVKVINSNKIEMFEKQKRIMRKYPERYKILIAFKGKHSSKKIYELIPALEKVVKSMLNNKYS